MTLKRSRRIFELLFTYSLILKAVLAGLETLSGFFLRFLPFQTVTRMIVSITPDDPTPGFFDRHITQWTHHLSIGELHFAGLYLMTHGAIKLLLVMGLLKKTIWMYPVAIVVFSIFVIYQLHRFVHTGAWGMFALSLFDLFVIYLIVREFRALRRS